MIYRRILVMFFVALLGVSAMSGSAQTPVASTIPDEPVVLTHNHPVPERGPLVGG